MNDETPEPVAEAEADTTSEAPAAPSSGKFLGWIERVGNKVPHPAVLFLALIGLVIIISQVLVWADVHATYEVVEPDPVAITQSDIAGSTGTSTDAPGSIDEDDLQVVTKRTEAQSLLTVEGIRFMFTSLVPTFMGFTAMGIILIVMIGVGIAELSGLVAALIRKLVAVSSGAVLTYVIVALGVVSSVASDAGYLVLIPLGAAAFASVGRHPLAGLAAAFAGVAGGFGVNILLTPTDAVLTEVTNEAIALVDSSQSIDIASNLYFGIVSSILITVLGAIVTTRIVEPRLGEWKPSDAPEDGPGSTADAGMAVAADADIEPARESRGLKFAGIGTLVFLLVIGLLTLPSGAPLRDPETGSIIGTSPFMTSLVVIISLGFLVAGVCYGRGAGTMRSMTEFIEAITKSWAGLAGLLFLFLLIAVFISYFNYSNMATIAAVKLGDLLEQANLGQTSLLVGVVLITTLVNFIIPQAIAKWALLAPIFVPLFMRLDVPPETVLAAYRVGDSPTNVVTPIMAYFPLIVVFAARWQKSAGIGTVIALMIPYVVAISLAWTALLVAWSLLGLSFGPGA